MNRYWFKPRSRGLGANPCTWEGWVSTLVFMLAIATTPAWLSPLFADTQGGRISTLLVALALLVAFIGLCALKTEGGLRWRRGDEEPPGS